MFQQDKLLLQRKVPVSMYENCLRQVLIGLVLSSIPRHLGKWPGYYRSRSEMDSLHGNKDWHMAFADPVLDRMIASDGLYIFLGPCISSLFEPALSSNQ